MDDLMSFGQETLQSQPFSRLLGTRLETFEQGTAVLALDIQNSFTQQHGFVHGGVLSYLADNALTFAGGSVLGDSVTAEFKINYLRPAVGTRLKAIASVISAGKTQAVCQCHVIAFTGDGERTVAVAQGTISKVVARA